MKKYLVSLIPFAVCVVLSFVYANLKPVEFPNPRYPYASEGGLRYFSFMWLFFGAVFSLSFLCYFLIGDLFDWLDKVIKKWRSKNSAPPRNHKV